MAFQDADLKNSSRVFNPHNDVAYIFVPKAQNRLPEIMDAADAAREARHVSSHDLSPDSYDKNYIAEQMISDTISADPALARQISGYWLTDRGLIVRGTMAAAYRLNDTVKSLAWMAEGGDRAASWTPNLSGDFAAMVAQRVSRNVHELKANFQRLSGFDGDNTPRITAGRQPEMRYALAA